MGIYNVGGTELRVGDKVWIYTTLPTAEKFHLFGLPLVEELLDMVAVPIEVVKRIGAEVGTDGIYFVCKNGNRHNLLPALLKLSGHTQLFIAKQEDLCEVKKLRAGDIVLGTMVGWKVCQYRDTKGVAIRNTNDVFVMVSATKGISLTGYQEGNKLGSYGIVIGSKLMSLSESVSKEIQPILGYVSAEKGRKDVIKKIGNVYLGTGSKAYVYLGEGGIEVDLCDYAYHERLLGAGEGYDEIASRYLVIDRSSKLGRELYERIVTNKLTSSSISSYLSRVGIDLRYSSKASFQTVDEYISNYREVLDWNYLQAPLTLLGIESNLTNRKFKEYVGNFNLPSIGVINLKGKQSSKNLKLRLW